MRFSCSVHVDVGLIFSKTAARDDPIWLNITVRFVLLQKDIQLLRSTVLSTLVVVISLLYIYIEDL